MIQSLTKEIDRYQNIAEWLNANEMGFEWIFIETKLNQ